MEAARHRWTETEVVDVHGPEFLIRTYVEQSDVRRYLADIAVQQPLRQVCDVGAGYGRMSVVLREFCDRVVAFEQEPSLLAKGSFLLPTITFRKVEDIQRLPAEDGEFDLALTFTVLQHLTHAVAKATLAEIRRVVRPGGYVLLCEESDDSFTEGDPTDPTTYFTFGRSLEHYKAWMEPFFLLRTSRRTVERGYPRANVGDYLLFQAPPEPNSQM